MRRAALAVTAALAFASFGATTAHAQPSCIGLPCDVINAVCRLVAHNDCVG